MMKKKIPVILLFIFFALPIPVAMLGCFLTVIWFISAVLADASVIEIISALTGVLIGATYIISYIYAMVKTWEEKKLSKKSCLPLIHCLVAVMYLLSLNLTAHYISQTTEYFGFAKKDFTVVEEVDTHGGFIGDGDYRLILDCSNNKEKAREKVKDWNKLPLSKNLNLIMYGGKNDAGTYRSGLAEDANIPMIENGYYIFEDRHSESVDSTDDTELFNRASYNFSIAIYDCDADMMYFFANDT